MPEVKLWKLELLNGITKQEVENSWIVKNSNLTVEKIRFSKNFNVLKPKIQAIINFYSAGATAFNNGFDFTFLEAAGIKFGKKLPDPMKLLTPIMKLPGKIGYKWPKVEEAYSYLFPKENYKEMHRGADDAFDEAKIVYELYKRGFFSIR